MARIPLPDGHGPEVERVWSIDPPIGDAVRALGHAVYASNHLPLRVHEAVRYLVATTNRCPVCLATRFGDLPETFYDAVAAWRTSDVFDERERLALEFADLFCHDHLAIDDLLFDRLRAAFDPVELIDLCVTVARDMAFGRLTQVLGLDTGCALPSRPPLVPVPASR